MSDFKIDLDYDNSVVVAGLKGRLDTGNDLESLFRDISEYLIPRHEESWE